VSPRVLRGSANYILAVRGKRVEMEVWHYSADESWRASLFVWGAPERIRLPPQKTWAAAYRAAMRAADAAVPRKRKAKP